MRIGGPAVLLWLVLPAEATADTREASARCGARARRTAEAGFGGEVVTVSPGGVCHLGAGVSPTLTATLGYGFTRSGPLRVADDAPGTSFVFRRQRHDLGLGLAWAPSDELTPLVHLEVGAAATTTADPQRRLVTPAGERRVPPVLSEQTTWSPRIHLEMAVEWRYLEQASIAGGPFIDWTDGGFGLGAGLWFGLYRYL
jgi:hypothetical protein